MPTPLIEDPDYELFCRQRLQNPYPLFARLREQDPVHWCEPMKMWLVTRYDDVLDGIKNTSRLSSSRQGMYTDPLRSENREAARPMIEHLNRWLLNIDPPDHTRMRRLVNLAFTPRFLQRLVPRIEAIVEQLTTMPGSEVALKLEIDAEVPSGMDKGKVRTLIENATTLGFIDKEIR